MPKLKIFTRQDCPLLSRKERHYIARLQRRLEYLDSLFEWDPAGKWSYERQEANALEWAIEKLTEEPLSGTATK